MAEAAAAAQAFGTPCDDGSSDNDSAAADEEDDDDDQDQMCDAIDGQLSVIDRAPEAEASSAGITSASLAAAAQAGDEASTLPELT